MAQTEINGSDIIVLIDRTGSGTFVPMACLKSNTISSSLTELDGSSKCGNKWIPGSKFEDTITGEGNAIDQDGANTVNSYTQLYALFSEKVQFPVKFGKASPTSGDVVYSGICFITKFELVAPFDELMTFSITLRNTAPPFTQTMTY
jgi:predicted secreted protein